jgi:cytochrome c2
VKKIGPSLLGVFGRRAGWAPNYKPSQALLGASRSGSDESPEGKGKI